MASGKFTVWDYSFALADKNLAGEEPIAEKAAVGMAEHQFRVAQNVDELQVFDYPGGYADRYDPVSPHGTDKDSAASNIHKDKDRVAHLRMPEALAASLICRGEGQCRHFTAGHKFTLAAPLFSSDATGSYVLTRVEHSAGLHRASATGTAGTGPSYHCRFECLPEAVVYRPQRRTPRPNIAGLQTAVVVGPSEPGRLSRQIRPGSRAILLGPDRAERPQGPARRRANPVAILARKQGQRGHRFLLGTGGAAVGRPELRRAVCAASGPGSGGRTFLEGDPDRPLVLGSVYNEINRPPFNLPVGGLCSGIKTHSGGGEGPEFSGLAFDDRLGFVHLARKSTWSSRPRAAWSLTYRRGPQNQPQRPRTSLGKLAEGADEPGRLKRPREADQVATASQEHAMADKPPPNEAFNWTMGGLTVKPARPCRSFTAPMSRPSCRCRPPSRWATNSTYFDPFSFLS